MSIGTSGLPPECPFASTWRRRARQSSRSQIRRRRRSLIRLHARCLQRPWTREPTCHRCVGHPEGSAHLPCDTRVGLRRLRTDLGHPLAVRASWRGVAAPRHQVWLAAVEARLGTSDALTGSISTGWAPPSPRLPRFYFVTVSAGCLVLQVGGQDTDAARSPVTFIRPDNLLTTVLSIWPARDQLITWPPGTILTKDELTELGEWEGTQSEAVRPRGHLRHE